MRTDRDAPDVSSLAQLAHDLRNCLATLRSASHLLQKPIDDPALLAQIRTAFETEIERMAQLIDLHLDGASGADERPSTAAATDWGKIDLRQSVPIADSHRGDGVAAGFAIHKRVLVADDNVDATSSLAMILRFDGHEVVTANDGLEALELADTIQPDIVLLDIGMPLKDGFEVAREIHSRPWAAHCKLIAVSGWGRPEDRARSLAAGFDEHLAKPIDMDALSRMLAN